MRSVPLSSVKNVRDLGGLAVKGGRVIKRGLLFRGGALHDLSPQDEATLFDDLRITCVIDLRCGWEVEARPDRIPDGIRFLHIPFYDEELVGIGYTKCAPGTLPDGPEIACDPQDFYRSLANPLTVGQMRRCLREVFACACRGQAVYQHCSGGKDRTGILTALVLGVLGAAPDDILDDYLLTNVERDQDFESNFQRFLRLAQGDEELARQLTLDHRAKEENLQVFDAAVKARYGSWKKFMTEQLGIDGESRERIRELCTEATPVPRVIFPSQTEAVLR